MDVGVGVCENMSEIQCGGQGGHEGMIPGTSPANPISALFVMMKTSASELESRMWWAAHSALSESPRMEMDVMQEHH